MARWWRSPVVAVMILSCGVGLTGCMSKPPQAQERGKMAVPVKFEALEKGIQTTTTEYVGVLEADDAVTLKPEMDGMIQAILVQEGDTVQAGTPILVLKSDRDQASVQQAIANVEAAQAAEESAKAQLNAVKAEKEEAQADLTLKQQDLKRVQELVESGALPKRNLDQSRRDVDVAIARINTINQRIKAAEANINQAQATRRQVNNTVAIANEDLRETQVTAPVSGKIGDLSVKVGDYLERGSDIATITQNANLSLNFFVPIEQAPNLRLNLPVELIDYRTLNTIGTGKVSFIAPEVDLSSQTLLAKASFDNPGDRLFTGQLVKAKVIWQQQFGISVPVTAISRLGGETFVFVAQPNPEGDSTSLIAVQKPVKLGKIDGDRYHVLEGLRPGEKIITTGILNLNDGVPITPQTDEPAKP